MSSPKIQNRVTGEPVSNDVAAYIVQLRTVRSNARRAARSGNPAKRGPALRVLSQVPLAIDAAYRQDTSKHMAGAR